MKKFFLLCAIVLFSASSAYSQFKAHEWELGMSGILGSVSSKQESSGYEASADHTFMSVSFQPAYYIIDGLFFEPEIGITASEGSQPGFFLLGNIGYTYLPKGSWIAPYARVGYGISNSIGIPTMNSYNQMSDDLKVGVLNLGAGAKFLVSKSVNLRAEVNYRKFTKSEDIDSYNGSYTIDYTISYINFWFGFSVNL
jgi:opacity protein-like surface antigen